MVEAWGWSHGPGPAFPVKEAIHVAQVQAYLGFRGNCAEAMRFYQQALGGEPSIMTVGDSPQREHLPAGRHAEVMHASLTGGGFTLNASDMADAAQTSGLVSLTVQCDPADDVRGMFARLAEGGAVTHPLTPSFWGSLFGHLTDRHGVHWSLNQEGAQG